MSDEPTEPEAPKQSPWRYIEDPSKYLIESGLLFEIDRRVLHPYGLALSLDVNPDDTASKQFNVRLWDCTHDPEGINFADDLLEKGKEKFRKFREVHKKRLASRFSALGYIIQGED